MYLEEAVSSGPMFFGLVPWIIFFPVIGLLMGDEGIPGTSDGRLAIAHKIVDRAKSLGIPQEDIIFDCLALTVSTNGDAAKITLDTIRRIVATSCA